MKYIGMTLILASFLLSIYSIVQYFGFIKTNESSFLTRGNKAHKLLAGILLAVGALLFYAIITHDFSLSYVANYSSMKEEWFYLISTFWAGQEGTFYLWMMYTVGFGLILIRLNDEFLPYVMIVLHLTIFFILLILLKQSPFRPLDPAIVAGIQDGRGLNPLLKNPWMVIHPPTLFLGYSSVIVPAAYAIAALWTNKTGAWIKYAFPWALFSAAILGLGVMMGGYWAYVTLGWGGYWAWDPVENASIFPWFFILACFHGMLIYRSTKGFLKTTLFLAIGSYLLMLYGSFLTRSGVLGDASVHSFSSLGINEYLVVFIGAYILFAYYWFFKRFKEIPSVPLEDKLNKEMILGFAVVIFTLATFAILIGTSIPLVTLIPWIADKQQTASQADQYNLVFSYVAVIVGLFVGLGPAFNWKRTGWFVAKRYLLVSIVFGIVLTAIVYNSFPNLRIQYYAIFATAGFALAINTSTIISKWKSKILRASSISHTGWALMLIGFIASSALGYSERVFLLENEDVSFKDLTLRYTGNKIDTSDPSKSYYYLNVQEDGSKYTVELPIEYNAISKSVMGRPDLSHSLTSDMYYSLVIPYVYEVGKKQKLIAGESFQTDGLHVTFTGFTVNEMNPAENIFRVQANFKAEENGLIKTFTAKYEQKFGQNNADIVKVPELNFQVRVMKVNASEKSVEIVYNPLDKDVVKEQIEIELSKKPYIIVLWLGTLIMVFGLLFTLRLRSKQLKSSGRELQHEHIENAAQAVS